MPIRELSAESQDEILRINEEDKLTKRGCAIRIKS